MLPVILRTQYNTYIALFMLTLNEMITALERYGITAKRKTIYE